MSFMTQKHMFRQCCCCCLFAIIVAVIVVVVVIVAASSLLFMLFSFMFLLTVMTAILCLLSLHLSFRNNNKKMRGKCVEKSGKCSLRDTMPGINVKCISIIPYLLTHLGVSPYHMGNAQLLCSLCFKFVSPYYKFCLLERRHFVWFLSLKRNWNNMRIIMK